MLLKTAIDVFSVPVARSAQLFIYLPFAAPLFAIAVVAVVGPAIVFSWQKPQLLLRELLSNIWATVFSSASTCFKCVCIVRNYFFAKVADCPS